MYKNNSGKTSRFEFCSRQIGDQCELFNCNTKTTSKLFRETGLRNIMNARCVVKATSMLWWMQTILANGCSVFDLLLRERVGRALSGRKTRCFHWKTIKIIARQFSFLVTWTKNILMDHEKKISFPPFFRSSCGLFALLVTNLGLQRLLLVAIKDDATPFDLPNLLSQ